MGEALKSLGLMIRLVVRSDLKRAVLSFVLFAVQGLWVILNALWLKVIVDGVVRGDTSSAMWGVGALAATAIVGMISNWTGVVTLQRLRERLDWLIDRELITTSSEIPFLEHHERPEYLKEMELLRQDKGELAGSVQTLVTNLSTVIQVIAIAILLAYLHPVLLLLPAFAIPSLYIGAKVESLRQRVNEQSVEKVRLADHLFEVATTAGPAKELRIFDLRDEMPQRHARAWEEFDRLRRRAALKGASLTALGWLVFAIGFVGAIVLVVVRAVEGRATPGDVVLAIQLTGQVNQQVASAVSGASRLLRDLKTLRRFRWLLDYASEVRVRIKPPEPLPVPPRLERGIEIQNLSFSYPGTESLVLKDLNLTLPAGATVAFVGENGAGKTTLVKLLCRFYDPDAGAIELDGFDLRRLEVEEWREVIATGFQDFVRFEFLARETVGVGNLPAIEDVAAVEESLTRAGGADVVPTLPAGLETQLGKTFEGGVGLSEGQWQKLALGRAMMRTRPLLLILDEPTASLDAPTEHALFERYVARARAAAEEGGITILVSHRFSTVRMANLIVVLDEGRIVGHGSHEELIARGGLYSELYELQAQRYR